MRLERTRQNLAILQYSTVPGVDPFLSTKALTNPKNPQYIAIWQGFHQLNTLRCFTSVATSSTSRLSCGVNSDKECYNETSDAPMIGSTIGNRFISLKIIISVSAFL